MRRSGILYNTRYGRNRGGRVLPRSHRNQGGGSFLGQIKWKPMATLLVLLFLYLAVSLSASRRQSSPGGYTGEPRRDGGSLLGAEMKEGSGPSFVDSGREQQQG